MATTEQHTSDKTMISALVPTRMVTELRAAAEETESTVSGQIRLALRRHLSLTNSETLGHHPEGSAKTGGRARYVTG